MSKITASVDFDRVKPEELPKFLAKFGEQVVAATNNGLDLATNFNGKSLSITFGSANTDTTVAHGLGRIPTGYLVTSRSANLTVYNGLASNTSTNLTLRASASGTVTVFVY